jgi:succinate dehydrogenase assembly factor 2
MIRSITGSLRRTVAAPLVQPARMARMGAARALSTSSPLLSSSRPDVPNPSQTDQGSTGPGQSQPASGPSGTVPDRTLSDPYPLPFSPDIVDLNNADSGPESGPQSKWAGVNLASDRQTLDDVDAPMRVPGRETEDRTTKIARLVYQCRKRGTLETDLLLSTFAKKELNNLPNEELDEFDRVCCPSPTTPRAATAASIREVLTKFIMPVFALASHDSCSTSQTGTSSIGARCASPSPSAGTTPSTPRASSVTDSSSTQRTRRRPSAGCPNFKNCLQTQSLLLLRNAIKFVHIITSHTEREKSRQRSSVKQAEESSMSA